MKSNFLKILFLILTHGIMNHTQAQTVLYSMPHEADMHEGTWIAWPHDYTYGTGNRMYSEQIWIEMTKALTFGENVHIIAYDETEQTHIEQVLENEGVDMAKVDFYLFQTDDYWMRDNGPIYAYDQNNNLILTDWNFNGWGFRAPYEKDVLIPSKIGDVTGTTPIDVSAMVLEGGAVEVDGNGSALLCRSSVTNSNRNPNLTETEVETLMTENLGINHFIWLDGTPNIDFTDFHIDGFARFFDSNTIITLDSSDLLEMGTTPNDIETLYNAQKPNGGNYDYIFLPQTQNNVSNFWGEPLGYKGSYVNFYIGNTCVLVPTYNDANDQIALDLIQGIYPDRTVIGIDVTRIYEYGGMIHCITQQQPIDLNTTSLSHLETQTRLIENFPNPFNHTTTISFSMENNEHGIIRIYNALGQQVEMIITKKGEQQIELNSNNFESGIYLYTLEVNGEIVGSQKMVINK